MVRFHHEGPTPRSDAGSSVIVPSSPSPSPLAAPLSLARAPTIFLTRPKMPYTQSRNCRFESDSLHTVLVTATSIVGSHTRAPGHDRTKCSDSLFGKGLILEDGSIQRLFHSGEKPLQQLARRSHTPLPDAGELAELTSELHASRARVRRGAPLPYRRALSFARA